MKQKLAAIVLAAGVGKRMRSRLPKVLHQCGDLPMVAHVVRVALARRCNPVVVVVNPKAPEVRGALSALFPKAPLLFATQEKPLGTGDAARAGLAALGHHKGRVLLVYGDVPLLTANTVARLEKAARKAPLALATTELTNPGGYGRIVREKGAVTRIVEHKDANAQELALREINAGVYVVSVALLRQGLARLSRNNAQKEAYLTDIVPLAARGGGAVAVNVADFSEVCGVNTRAELSAAEATLHQRLIAYHQARGVTFHNPQMVSIGVLVELAPDVEIGPGVQLCGEVKVGRGTCIHGPTVVRDTTIAESVTIAAFCHLEGAVVARGAKIGPFARLRPGAQIDEAAHVGNFVELKKTRLGKGAKANHLAYLGDADIGAGANIGAGTITCNYDGINKSKTRIGTSAFIGSNSTLVAPICINAGAYVAAGSTLTNDVQKDALAFGRARQTNRPGYAAKLRQRLRAKKEST